jgi:hypothetical protein
MVVRFAPTVHGASGAQRFVAVLARIAREKDISGYIREGQNRWSAVNRLDAGKLAQLAIDKAAPGSVLHAVADGGVGTRDIAAALGQFLAMPVQSISADRAQAHFDWLGMFFGAGGQRTHACAAGLGVDARDAVGRHRSRALPWKLNAGWPATRGATIASAMHCARRYS